LNFAARFNVERLVIFASIAVILSTRGIYALLAYSVRLLTRELGVRMALGADRRSILELTTIRGMRIVLPGLVAGTAGASILSAMLSTLLLEVKATDPITFRLANARLEGTAFWAM
jgi:ABC-type antimicrobial peptide transport system permease subunit